MKNRGRVGIRGIKVEGRSIWRGGNFWNGSNWSRLLGHCFVNFAFFLYFLARLADYFVDSFSKILVRSFHIHFSSFNTLFHFLRLNHLSFFYPNFFLCSLPVDHHHTRLTSCRFLLLLLWLWNVFFYLLTPLRSIRHSFAWKCALSIRTRIMFGSTLLIF